MRSFHFMFLLALTGLFVLRVVTQLVQSFAPVSFLPPFSEWHGAVLPYPWLLSAQVIIITLLVIALCRIKADLITPNRWKYYACFSLGGLYFATMTFRLIAGFTIFSSQPWFSKHLPAFFHLVLASCILLIGHYLYKKLKEGRLYFEGPSPISRLVAVSSYPGIMLFCFALYGAATVAGLNVTIASYASVLTGAILITLHEYLFPFREDWRPSSKEIGTDSLFMIIVQVVLPYFLSITLVVMVSGYFKDFGFTVEWFWPHEYPLIVQAGLMLLVADFPRYWMHRACHNHSFPWRFHAVHHAPKRLYWMNVGRFHPIEKAAQFCVDALPFTLLGLSSDVLAAYFVFYAINGFFQHSNGRIYLGPLNYIVSGPELHRWHHSRKISESNNNYGNNLIIWDLIFGTHYLPKDRLVGELGLINRDYPTGFGAKLKSPFVNGLDKVKQCQK